MSELSVIPDHWPSVKQKWICPGSGKKVKTKPSESDGRVAFDCPDCGKGWTRALTPPDAGEKTS